ncbi:GNAT family N-acetyltransferase [Propionibacteriaceae bacterium Y2011]
MADELQTWTKTSPEERIRTFFEATQFGFHMPRATDDAFQHWLPTVSADDVTMRVLPDPDEPDGLPVATFASFDKTIQTGSELLPVHMITDVTVSPTHRRRGLLRTMMTADLTAAYEAGLPVAALTVTEATIYGRFGFGPGTFEQSVEVDTSVKFAHRPGLADTEGRIRMVKPETSWDMISGVFTRFHATTRGSIDRPDHYRLWLTNEFDFDADAKGRKLRLAVHLDAAGECDGYVAYEVDRSTRPRTIKVGDLIALNRTARIGLWEFLASIDLVEKIVVNNSPLDDPLPWSIIDRGGYKITGVSDSLWFRLLDAERCLAARPWLADGEIVLGITDPMGFTDGSYAIRAADGRAEVTRTTDPAEVTVDIETASSLWLGGTTTSRMVEAGRIGGSPEAITRFAAMSDLHTPPHSITFF